MKAQFSVPAVLLVLLVLLLLAGVMTGAYELSGTNLWRALTGRAEELEQFLVWQVRIPRLLLAVVVGAALAVT
ncbi:MAG: ABC-type Fe3+-siderophore transport system permease subunit, partial [Limisphaerales bacterium]